MNSSEAEKKKRYLYFVEMQGMGIKYSVGEIMTECGCSELEAIAIKNGSYFKKAEEIVEVVEGEWLTETNSTVLTRSIIGICRDKQRRF